MRELEDEEQKAEKGFFERLAELEKAVEEKALKLHRFFSAPLGLRVERGAPGLQFVFTSVSPNDPRRECTFTISKDGRFSTEPYIDINHMQKPFHSRSLPLRQLLVSVRAAFKKKLSSV